MYALQAKANSDAEGDTFFLDSQDDQPFEEAAASSAEPAASVAVPRSKRGRTEGGASQEQQGVARQAQTGIAQQTQKGRARQGQKSMPRQARNDAAPQADDATGLITVHDQPPAKRQALASSPQMKKAAAKGVKSSSTADISGLGSAQQSAQHDRPLVLQPSSHATQRSAPAQPMPGPTSSARSNGKLEQSVREIDSARQECDRSRAVLVADKVIWSSRIVVSVSKKGQCACKLLLCLLSARGKAIMLMDISCLCLRKFAPVCLEL